MMFAAGSLESSSACCPQAVSHVKDTQKCIENRMTDDEAMRRRNAGREYRRSTSYWLTCDVKYMMMSRQIT